MGTQGTPPTRNCVQCGRSIAMDANVCPYCGHDYRAVAAAPPAKKQTAMPLIGGILIIIAGLLEIVYGGMMAVGGSAANSIPVVGDDIGNILAVCGAILIILGLVALLGGVFALQRKSFGLAVLGGILGLAGWFIPALIGLILVAISREEFK